MGRKTSKNCFGAPSDFSMSQLPTYACVGKQFSKCKNDLKAQNPGANVSTLDACKLVSCWVFTTKCVIPVVYLNMAINTALFLFVDHIEKADRPTN